MVRRLKHTPNLPMPYVFSEATENKEVRHIYWEPGKKRAHSQVAERGKVIELFMPFSSSSFPRTRPSSRLQVFVAIAQPIFSVGFIETGQPLQLLSQDVFCKSQVRTTESGPPNTTARPSTSSLNQAWAAPGGGEGGREASATAQCNHGTPQHFLVCACQIAPHKVLVQAALRGGAAEDRWTLNEAAAGLRLSRYRMSFPKS